MPRWMREGKAAATVAALTAQADADEAAVRELQRHPVGSESGYRAAFQSAMMDSRTATEPCGLSRAHGPHLWRNVRNVAAPDVDERLKRCDGKGE